MGARSQSMGRFQLKVNICVSVTPAVNNNRLWKCPVLTRYKRDARLECIFQFLGDLLALSSHRERHVDDRAFET